MQTALYLFSHIFVFVLKEGSDTAVEEVMHEHVAINSHIGSFIKSLWLYHKPMCLVS